MKISCILLSCIITCAAFTSVSTNRLYTYNAALASSVAADEDTFYQAVQLAEAGEKKIDLDELDRLATALEQVEGCQFEEEGGGLCEKEIQDRLDVAEVLRLQIELQLRLDYLKNANLFADDVKKEHDREERKKFKAALEENRNKSPGGSDLGLW